jgi:hypothetical protein
MNATEAINKIADLLGLKFKSEKFSVTKLIDDVTTITNNSEEPFAVGNELFVVGEDSILKPAPAGEHKTRDGILLVVGEDSVISKIEEIKEEVESPEVEESSTDVMVNEETMAKAKLTDGTEIMTDEEGDFKVGEKLYAITKEGEKVSAPEGEHTTDSGIVLTVNGEGFITGVKYPDMAGQGSLEDYKKEMKKMKEAMSEMMAVMSKFSKDFESYKNDYEDFKNSPVFEAPVSRKTFAKENMADAKVAFLRNALKK